MRVSARMLVVYPKRKREPLRTNR